MSISADTLRGHTDTIILTQLMRGDNYGYEINKNIQQRTNGEYGFKEATLYTAFKRLEQNGLITSYWGADGPGAVSYTHLDVYKRQPGHRPGRRRNLAGGRALAAPAHGQRQLQRL